MGYKVHFQTPSNGKRQSVHPCCVWHSGATWMALRFLAWRRARKWHGTFASLRHVKDRGGFKCHDVSWWIGRLFAGVTKTTVASIQKWTVQFGWFGVPPWVGNLHIYAMGRAWADGMMAVTIWVSWDVSENHCDTKMVFRSFNIGVRGRFGCTGICLLISSSCKRPQTWKNLPAWGWDEQQQSMCIPQDT